MATVLVERHDREFEKLYRRYAPEVHRYALALSQNEVDAEDVTQQTFMNAYRALLRGEQPKAPLHWLIVIAHNVFRERLRRSSRRPVEVALDDNLRVASSEESSWSAEDIRHALSHLYPKQRAVIVLRELEGRPYSEIAENLGLSQAATEALAFRARRALREQLEAELTCQEAQAAVLRRLDGGLSAAEHGALRAHLRACAACAGAARSRRGRRRRHLGSLGLLPFPLPLKSLFGGSASAGATSVGGGVAVKAAAVAAAGVVATGVGYETVRHVAHPAGGSTVAAVAQRPSRGSAPRRNTRVSVHLPRVGQATPVADARRHPAPTAHRPIQANRHERRNHVQAATPPEPVAARALPPARQVTPQGPAPKAHARSKPAASKHDASAGHPAKHAPVQKAQHRGRSAESRGHAGRAHSKAAGKDSGTHGKGNGGKSQADAASAAQPEALPPPPAEAVAGEADG